MCIRDRSQLTDRQRFVPSFFMLKSYQKVSRRWKVKCMKRGVYAVAVSYTHLNFLKTFDEPTILVFTGDHFPFFTPECNYYRDMGITVDNCEKLYEKTWLVWNNYDLDTSSLPKTTFSTFYLPHLVYQLAGFESPFVDTILKEMATRPIYSIAVNPSTNSELLDLLTYDRTMGNNYSEPVSYTHLDRTPPARLRAPAVMPRVRRTNPDFSTAMQRASPCLLYTSRCV